MTLGPDCALYITLHGLLHVHGCILFYDQSKSLGYIDVLQRSFSPGGDYSQLYYAPVHAAASILHGFFQSLVIKTASDHMDQRKVLQCTPCQPGLYTQSKYIQASNQSTDYNRQLANVAYSLLASMTYGHNPPTIQLQPFQFYD